jgi:hypothetical protein
VAFAGELSCRWLPILATWLVSSACSDESTARGELGNVTFTYVCSGDGDYQCLDGQRGMPDHLGVGAHFDVEEDEFFSTRENLETASPNVIEDDGASFTFLKEGYGAILILENFGEIEDFVHLKGITVETLRIEDEDRSPISRVTFLAGTRKSVVVIPEARDGIIPGGSFDYVWESNDVGVVLPSSGFGSNRVDLVGVAPGASSVSVTVRGLVRRLIVEVTENPDLPALGRDGGSALPEPSDAGPDTDAAGVDGGRVWMDVGSREDAAPPLAPSEAGPAVSEDAEARTADASSPASEAGTTEGGAP